MAYQAISIKEAVNEINAKYFLPHIQRELVWQPAQISKLFDSLMRGYPINTFLFWRVTGDKDVTKLKFIENYKKGKKNELHTNTERDEYFLVLDGQQRLQSFYIALRGTYEGKELFLNALSEKPTEEDTDNDEENEIIYETRFLKRPADYFLEKDAEEGANKLWIKIKSFALLDEDRLYDFIEGLKEEPTINQLSISEGKLLERNLKKLHDYVSSKDTIFYYLENEEDYNRVLDIFIRTNSGGTKLSKSDLLFSMVKLRWERDAYQEFNELESAINSKGDFEFDKDFILKTSLVLVGADPRYRIENFNRENISKIEKEWDKIEDSIRITIDLLVSYRFTTKKILTSKNSLIPIIYYAYTNGLSTYASNEAMTARNREVIRGWLLHVLLVNLFSSQTDEMLSRARSVIDANKGREFPGKEILSNLPPGKSAMIRRVDFDDIRYGDRKGWAFIVLALLYPGFDLNSLAEANKPNIDHIFPKSLEKKGFDLDILNNIGNLELLTDTENKSKNATPFEQWLQSRDPAFIRNNYIPEDRALYSEDRYKDFIQARRAVMLDEVVKRLGDIESL